MMFLQRKNGFTLIELMVVVVIIGVLASVAVPLYTRTIKNSRTAEATVRLSAIMKAAKVYYLQHGRWPSESSLGFLADFSNTVHFRYKIQSGAGGRRRFRIRAVGLNVDGMKRVRVTMTCSNVEAEPVIVIDRL
jgi:prepilin-type N-terminal cleavage/methylation domain-containing protein